MNSPKISLIVPVYNQDKYLKECLDSILAQELKDIEIIIIDDGSTDTSSRILEEYAIKDSRIKLLRQQENKGTSSARNRGISVARGEYLGFVDPDDKVDHRMFGTLYSAAKESGSDIVFSGFIEDYGRRRIPIEYPLLSHSHKKISRINKEALIEHVVSGSLHAFVWNKLFKASLIVENGIKFPENLPLMHDIPFVLDALAKANFGLYIPQELYLFRRHELSNSLKYRPDKFDILLVLLRKKMQIASETLHGISCIKPKIYSWFLRSVIDTLLGVYKNIKIDKISRDRIINEIIGNDSVRESLKYARVGLRYSIFALPVRLRNLRLLYSLISIYTFLNKSRSLSAAD